MTPKKENQSKSPKVCIVGFGFVGLVLGAVLASRGCSVTGIDRDRERVEAVMRGETPIYEPGLATLLGGAVAGGSLEITDDAAAAADCDVVLITVGTPLSDDGDADLGQLTAAVEGLAPHLQGGQLVILKCTVPPGTTRDLVLPILAAAADVHLAFCPERIAEGRAVEELTRIPVVVGGINEESTKRACLFWERTLGVETVTVNNPEAAELVKLADNLWIDLNIALANELAKLSDGIGGIDVLEVIRAANTLPKLDHNVNILLPSLGVGGACLTKDPWFVRRLGERLGLDLLTPEISRRVNDAMPAYAVELIERHLTADGDRTPEDCRIAVLGLAFKSDTGDCRFTPVAPALEALSRRGFRLVLYDGCVSAAEAAAVTDLPLAPDIESAVKGADCVAYFTGHQEFHDFPLDRLAALVKPGALVVDGRMFFSRERIAKIEELGLRFKGIGR